MTKESYPWLSGMWSVNPSFLEVLAFGTEAVIPAEIGMPTYRTSQPLTEENDQALRVRVNLDFSRKGET